MSPRRWLLTTTLLVLGLGGGVIGTNVILDPYGLYRPTQGRRIVSYGDSRIAKYLLNARYVPENFNAVLIGSSVTGNWDMSRVEKLKIYNDSLNGGNITEGDALLEMAIRQPGISTVVLLVHPAMTSDHDFETVRLRPDLTRSALGSLSLLDAYKDMIYVRLHRRPTFETFDAAGTETFDDLPTEMNSSMKALWKPGDSFDVDPIALATYRDAIRQVRAKRLQIIFVVPPTAEYLLQTKRAAFDRYVEMIRADSTPDDLWIDFMTDEYAAFRRDRTHFPDGSHLTPEAAGIVVSYVDAAIDDWFDRERVGRGVDRERVATRR